MLARLDYMNRDFLPTYLWILHNKSQVQLKIEQLRNIRSSRCPPGRNHRFPALRMFNHLYQPHPYRYKRTAAVSMPVGPPPQTTNDSKRFRSSGVVVGRQAVSKLSEKPQINDGRTKRKDLTEDSSSDSLRIRDGFELEAVL